MATSVHRGWKRQPKTTFRSPEIGGASNNRLRTDMCGTRSVPTTQRRRAILRTTRTVSPGSTSELNAPLLSRGVGAE
jgi:hypothetical protein